jgi:pyrroloquinoline quinone biosynthesis protein B
MVPAPIVEAVAVGTAQDGGVPQAGCTCPTCNQARSNPAQRRLVASLALIDRQAHASWLIDATPHLPDQLDRLQQIAPDCPLQGLLLTHAHIGHYTGLIHFGREVINSRGMPVYVTPAMAAFLRSNGPWSQLIHLENLAPYTVQPNQALALSSRLQITPLLVPHRSEFSDTLAVQISGPDRTLFYCPDIDRWEAWDRELPDYLAGIDIALLDGTFYSSEELPGRDLREIPHPLIRDTAGRLRESPCLVRFIHINHSNPLLQPGPARDWLAGLGMGIAAEGERWTL